MLLGRCRIAPGAIDWLDLRCDRAFGIGLHANGAALAAIAVIEVVTPPTDGAGADEAGGAGVDVGALKQVEDAARFNAGGDVVAFVANVSIHCDATDGDEAEAESLICQREAIR